MPGFLLHAPLPVNQAEVVVHIVLGGKVPRQQACGHVLPAHLALHLSPPPPLLTEDDVCPGAAGILQQDCLDLAGQESHGLSCFCVGLEPHTVKELGEKVDVSLQVGGAPGGNELVFGKEDCHQGPDFPKGTALLQQLPPSLADDCVHHQVEDGGGDWVALDDVASGLERAVVVPHCPAHQQYVLPEASKQADGLLPYPTIVQNVQAEDLKAWLRGTERKQKASREGGYKSFGDQWQLLVRLVRHIWETSKIPRQLLTTTVVLIPKGNSGTSGALIC